MAVPVVASVGSAVTGTGTSISTSAPSGVSSGDLLVLTVTVTTSTTITTPTNWNDVDTVADGSATLRTSMFYRVANGGADDTPTVSLGASVTYIAVIARITGATSSPFDVKNTASSTSDSAPPIASVTTTTADELVIASIAINAVGAFTSNPSTWTQQASGTSGGNSTMRIYSKDAASATSYGGETASLIAALKTTQITAAFKSTSGGSTVSRTLSENMASTDTPLRSCTNLRTASERLALQEVQFYKPNYKTFTHESLGFVDTAVVLPTWRRGVSDNFGFRDPTITRTSQYARALSEQFGFTESISRSATLLRTISELLALRDTIGDIQTTGPGGTTWHRTLAESLAMIDSMTRTTQYQRSIIESLGITESILRRADCKRALSENMAFQEQINRAMTALRSIAESLGMSDAAILRLISNNPGATSRRFYRPGMLDYQWERPARVETEDQHRGTSDEQVL